MDCLFIVDELGNHQEMIKDLEVFDEGPIIFADVAWNEYSSVY